MKVDNKGLNKCDNCYAILNTNAHHIVLYDIEYFFCSEQCKQEFCNLISSFKNSKLVPMIPVESPDEDSIFLPSECDFTEYFDCSLPTFTLNRVTYTVDEHLGEYRYFNREGVMKSIPMESVSGIFLTDYLERNIL